ncbi:PAS/PAC sensor signal transduction histidine kinase [[Leptolyngbya] sp. PCC 7376]|uniref:PAS domain-containing sensor histidine kinase n=1 Tax=[Leptolyngbya] sp. PCC 7376 TaxID=111781 RepID=UPI00029F2588|nr:ATP-binding protein [[Leptolyngbya] sp. PCC 7376]AFY38425.1 PAS/PAC sensor signal transduction histidine kinase [[Leptolyngbya] sp. PCC 7376]
MSDENLQNELNTQIQYRLTEKLAQSERFHRNLIQSLKEIIFECDTSGNFIFLNQAWEKTLGYPVKNVIGNSILDYVEPNDKELVADIFRQTTPSTQPSLEVRFLNSEKEIVWLEMSFRENYNHQFSGSLVNITDRKNTEILQQKLNEDLENRVQERTNELTQSNQELRLTLDRLQKTQLQLIQAEKMSSLGQLVAGIAHEINNPISFVHGNLNFIKDYSQELLDGIDLFEKCYPESHSKIIEWQKEVDFEFLKEDLPKTLESVSLGTRRVQEIVLSLKSFSRTDEQGFKKVDIHKGIDDTLLILQNRLRDHPDIKIIKDYNFKQNIECYPGQLNQVFMNILANAIDALESSSQVNKAKEITIETSLIKKDKWVSICISDNGDGVPSAMRTRIFDPFFTTKPIGKGTGMGMAISYQIITEKHGGSLGCFSQEMQGTKFIIKIPVSHK